MHSTGVYCIRTPGKPAICASAFGWLSSSKLQKESLILFWMRSKEFHIRFANNCLSFFKKYSFFISISYLELLTLATTFSSSCGPWYYTLGCIDIIAEWRKRLDVLCGPFQLCFHDNGWLIQKAVGNSKCKWCCRELPPGWWEDRMQCSWFSIWHLLSWGAYCRN